MVLVILQSSLLRRCLVVDDPARGPRGLTVILLVPLVFFGCSQTPPPTRGVPQSSNTLSPEIGAATDGEIGVSTTRSAPRWESLENFAGRTAADFTLSIATGAIQWRVNWECESGSLEIKTTPSSRKPGPLASASCPAKGESYSILTGTVALHVEASGSWTATVDQQVETPLEEPPLPEMAGAPVEAEGSFYDIERTGGGAARIYRLSDGRRFLRLEGFTVSANTDLFVWLSETSRPTTSAETLASPRVVLGDLKSTAGSHNYEIPADLPTSRMGSIVIWCQPVAIAYSAAALDPP